MDATIHTIAEINNIQLKEITSLHGGSINSVFLLKSTSGNFALKLNNASKFPLMFETEANGLQLLKASNSFIIPSVIAQNEIENTSYLLMEYIPSGNKTSKFNSDFAEKLTILHRCSQDYFGLSHDNYIGSLPQSNNKEKTASDFYINQRIEPQIKLATQKGYSFKELDLIYKNISDTIPKKDPSLIHGDLWNGNYLTSIEGNPCLIDPAVSYGPREMDLAMMQLFGGFSEEIFEQYHELFPLAPNWKDRVSLWQLYYLFVHLNLFGGGYFSQVNSILKQYS